MGKWFCYFENKKKAMYYILIAASDLDVAIKIGNKFAELDKSFLIGVIPYVGRS